MFRRVDAGEARRARVEAMYQEYKQTGSMEDVGARHGLTRQSISRLFRQYGFHALPRKQDQLDLPRLHVRYMAGERMEDLAAESQVNPRYLIALFHKCGYAVQGPGQPAKWTREHVADMHALYMQGLSQEEVGKLFGIGQRRVSTLFEQYGFPTR